VRKLLIVLAVTLITPGLAGLALYGFLRKGIIAKYDRCVAALSSEERQPFGLARIVDELRPLKRFAGVAWNLNVPYVHGAINILVPHRADETWHNECGLPIAPADCLAAAHEKFIICNAAMGRQLANPLLMSGIAREEIERARRFLALAFLGHELGHLQAGSGSRVQHLFPTTRPDGLKCTRPDERGPSGEQLADSFGVSVACEALQPGIEDLRATDARAVIATMSHLRETLDEDYFAFDDTCEGDVTYPSMSRRKSSFAFAYAKCLFPQADLPYASLADYQDAAIKHLEQWLRQRQLTGIVGSALYGADAVYRYDVAGTDAPNPFLAFDSSGKRSQVTATVVEQNKVEHRVLATWEQAGDIIDQRPHSPLGAAFLVAFAAPQNATDIRRIAVTCSSAPVQCGAETSEKRLPVGVEVRSTTAHAVIEITGRKVRTFAGAVDYMADREVLATTSDTPLGGDAAFVDGEAAQLLISRIPDEHETSSGFHRIGVLTGSSMRWTVFTTVPASLSPIAAIGVYGKRVIFVLRPASLEVVGTTQLWTCPLDVFTGVFQQADRALCEVYVVPAEASVSVGLANNDLTSLGTHLLKPDHCPGVIVVRQSGWLWLINPEQKLQDLLPGTGIVNCAADGSRAWIYRMRRLDEVQLAFEPAQPKSQQIGLIRQ
jgi:hypothetical protein